MDPTMIGWIGGIGGSVIGLLGGIFGTWCSLRYTRGPRERAFGVKLAVAAWIGAIAFALGMIFIPAPYKFFLVIPYVLAMVFGIPWANRVWLRIRQEESGAAV